MGSIICSLLLVVAMGCTCKLQNLRLREHSGRSSDYISPVARIQEGILARHSAPPQYDEAMATSRSFEEAQREFMQAVADGLINLDDATSNVADVPIISVEGASEQSQAVVENQVESNPEITPASNLDDVPMLDLTQGSGVTSVVEHESSVDDALIDPSVGPNYCRPETDDGSNVNISLGMEGSSAQWCRSAVKNSTNVANPWQLVAGPTGGDQDESAPPSVPESSTKPAPDANNTLTDPVIKESNTEISSVIADLEIAAQLPPEIEFCPSMTVAIEHENTPLSTSQPSGNSADDSEITIATPDGQPCDEESADASGLESENDVPSQDSLSLFEETDENCPLVKD